MWSGNFLSIWRFVIRSFSVRDSREHDIINKILKIVKMLSGSFLSLWRFVIRSFSQETLAENDGRGCVYLDGWVMGPNYGINYRFCRDPHTNNNLQNF